MRGRKGTHWVEKVSEWGRRQRAEGRKEGRGGRGGRLGKRRRQQREIRVDRVRTELI